VFRADEDTKRRASSSSATGSGRRAWAARPEVLARSLKLNGESLRDRRRDAAGLLTRLVVRASREIWVPLALSDADRAVRENHNQQAIARLAPGATLAQGLSELEVISKRLEQEHPQENAGWGATSLRCRT
jgi:hypothetical protein